VTFVSNTTAFTREEIEIERAKTTDARRHLIWTVPIFLTIIFIAFRAPEPLLLIGILVSIVGCTIFVRPGQQVKKYDTAAASWSEILKRSHPNTILSVNFPLQHNESIFYSEPSERFEERRTGQVIDTQTRTRNAVRSAAVGGILFGSAGMIVGGGMARRHTTGTSTDVYNVVPVDHGSLAITSDRIVFLGSHQTVDIATSRVMRFSTVEGTDRVNFEYAGRTPGESYTVNPALFNLCMVRRGKDQRFQIPIPPPPLDLDANDPIALQSLRNQKELDA